MKDISPIKGFKKLLNKKKKPDPVCTNFNKVNSSFKRSTTPRRSAGKGSRRVAVVESDISVNVLTVLNSQDKDGDYSDWDSITKVPFSDSDRTSSLEQLPFSRNISSRLDDVNRIDKRWSYAEPRSFAVPPLVQAYSPRYWACPNERDEAFDAWRSYQDPYARDYHHNWGYTTGAPVTSSNVPFGTVFGSGGGQSKSKNIRRWNYNISPTFGSTGSVTPRSSSKGTPSSSNDSTSRSLKTLGSTVSPSVSFNSRTDTAKISQINTICDKKIPRPRTFSQNSESVKRQSRKSANSKVIALNSSIRRRKSQPPSHRVNSSFKRSVTKNVEISDWVDDSPQASYEDIDTFPSNLDYLSYEDDIKHILPSKVEESSNYVLGSTFNGEDLIFVPPERRKHDQSAQSSLLTIQLPETNRKSGPFQSLRDSFHHHWPSSSLESGGSQRSCDFVYEELDGPQSLASSFTQLNLSSSYETGGRPHSIAGWEFLNKCRDVTFLSENQVNTTKPTPSTLRRKICQCNKRGKRK